MGYNRLLGVFLAVAVATVLLPVIWYSLNDYSDYITNQRELAQRSVGNAAREIEILISGRQSNVRLFANREQDLLRRLINNPDDVEAQLLFETRIDAYFPDRLGVTVANENGVPLIEQGSKLVGKVCRKDIRHYFSSTNNHLLYVHPSPRTTKLHFDVISDTSEFIQNNSVFFVSFFLDDLFRILEHNQTKSHLLVLVRKSTPELIEAPTDKLISQLENIVGELSQVPSVKRRSFRNVWGDSLNPHILASANVQGTQWELRGIAQAGLIDTRRNGLIAQASVIMVILFLVSLAVFWLVKRLEVSQGNTNAVLLRIEEERRRIAMDLHDHVLSDISHVRRECRQSGDASNQSIELQLKSITNTIRDVIDDLHPHSLELLGLPDTVRAYIDAITKNNDDIEISLDISNWEDARVESNMRLHLYRIIQELVDNVLRHSRATQCEILLEMSPNNLKLVVCDNGCGIRQRENQLLSGHGVVNIKERSRIIGAKIVWRVEKNKPGTKFKLEMSRP